MKTSHLVLLWMQHRRGEGHQAKSMNSMDCGLCGHCRPNEWDWKRFSVSSFAPSACSQASSSTRPGRVPPSRTRGLVLTFTRSACGGRGIKPPWGILSA
eukprot:3839159-Prymnesium_polylepis.1